MGQASKHENVEQVLNKFSLTASSLRERVDRCGFAFVAIGVPAGKGLQAALAHRWVGEPGRGCLWVDL